MGRVNKSTEGVFVNIVGSSSEISKYQQFLHRSPSSILSGKYQGLMTAYSNKCSVIKMDLQQLSELEVIIMQIRALTNMKDTIKLYTVRDTYVYGRCPFFRSDNDINEVRVLIDPIDLYFPDGTADLAMLSGNQLFMLRAYDKVSAVMLTEIVENVNNYKRIYSK